MKIIRDIPPKQPKNRWVAIDSEWFGMDERILHRPFLQDGITPNGKFACLSVCIEPGTVYVVDNELKVPVALNNLLDCVWVMHNSKFDITHLRRLAHIAPRKRLWDTMIIEQIMYSGLYERFSLKDLVRRHLNVKLDKEARETFINATELTDEQIEYTAKDAHYTLLVALDQRSEVTISDVQIWQEIDRPALFAFLDFRGARLDVDAWKILAATNQQQAKEIEESLAINPRSPTKVLSLLRSKGFKRLENTQEKSIQKALLQYPDTEAAVIARKILDARKLYKRASTYGMGFIEDHLETECDGIQVVFGNYHVIGAETGRTACSDPNLMNIPTRDTDVFRRCFIARPGHKLVILDYSQQEPMIAAYLSQDQKLIQAAHGDDVYIETAKIRYKERIEKSDPRRKRMKSIFLGLNYGMSAYGMSEKEGITIEDAEKEISEFFKTFKGLKKYMDKQVKEKRLVRTVLGRKIWLNQYNSQCERNALNGPMQGTATDMLKMSMGLIHSNWKFDCPFGMIIENHDEIVLDVPEELAPQVATYCQDYMERVANKMCPGIGFKVGVAIGDSWAEKE